MFLEDHIKSLIEEHNLSNKQWKTYSYNGINVPRVSDILKNMIHDEYLLGWANSLGFKRQSYTKVRNLSADKGTASHNLIEKFLLDGERITDFDNIDENVRYSVYNCYNGFLNWFDMIKENTNTFNILEVEKTLVCPYVGGTLDILAEINGKKYILDLKTSNHNSYKHFIQLAAYVYIITNFYGINIDGGVGIIMLNKEAIQYNDYILSFDNPYHLEMMNHCINTFLSLLYAYYNRIVLEEYYNDIFKGKLI